MRHKRAASKSACSAPAKDVDERNYVPTEAEVAATKAVLHKRTEQPQLPRLKCSKADNGARYTYDHPDQIIASCSAAVAIGAGDDRLASGLIGNLANVATRGNEVSYGNLNFSLAVVRGIEPKDAIEALLAVQMATIHNATMRAARRLANADMLQQHDSALNAVNKLARTFAVQVEALKKHRSAGEQTVRVEHVNVHEGGQAIVGIVHPPGGGGAAKIESQPHEPCATDERSSPVLGHVEANGKALPSPISARAQGVPVSRSTGRRANGTS
jgi:hypothetical protein